MYSISFHTGMTQKDDSRDKGCLKRTSQRRKWSPTANDPQTGNYPQIGPQMIPNRKWSPMWTANDPRRKITNGMDFGLLDFNFYSFFIIFFINWKIN